MLIEFQHVAICFVMYLYQTPIENWARGRGIAVALANHTSIYRSQDPLRLSTIRCMRESHDVAPTIAGVLLRGFLPVFPQ